MQQTLKSFVYATLRGVAQIMLQENALTGIFFLAGIFLGSFEMGFAALLASAVGVATAKLLKYDNNEIEQGLYGFSPALVGVALLLFFQSSAIVWIAVVLGSALAAILQHFFIIKKLPVYTFPFVFVTWIVYYSFTALLPNLTAINDGEYLHSAYVWLFPLRGVGQVIFQSSWISGLLFFIGLGINSHLSAITALFASIIAGLFAWLVGVSLDSLALGLLSYNAVLSAIVFQGNTKKEIGFNLLIVIYTTVLSLLMIKTSIVPLTFPFVLASFTAKYFMVKD